MEAARTSNISQSSLGAPASSAATQSFSAMLLPQPAAPAAKPDSQLADHSAQDTPEDDRKLCSAGSKGRRPLCGACLEQSCLTFPAELSREISWPFLARLD